MDTFKVRLDLLFNSSYRKYWHIWKFTYIQKNWEHIGKYEHTSTENNCWVKRFCRKQKSHNYFVIFNIFVMNELFFLFPSLQLWIFLCSPYNNFILWAFSLHLKSKTLSILSKKKIMLCPLKIYFVILKSYRMICI